MKDRRVLTISLMSLFLIGCGFSTECVWENATKTKSRHASVKSEDLIPNPEAVRKVEERIIDAGIATWWGFEENDSTKFLQAAIESGVSTLIIPDMGVPWQIDTIELESNQKIIFENGTVIMARKGGMVRKGSVLFNADYKENITIQGYGAVIAMRKEDYQRSPYEKSQWRHAISLRSCRNISIAGVTVRSSGGDGIYLGSSRKEGSKKYNENIQIKDVVLEDHHRQGISVISAKKLLIENVLITGTSGTPPQAGIDFEPNRQDEQLTDCKVKDCIIYGNRGPGILFYLGALDEDSASISVEVASSKIMANGVSVWVGGVKQNPPGTITFRGNRLGLLRYVKRSDNLSVRFLRKLML